LSLLPLKTRIAPTPSGFLHVGNVLNFLLIEAWAKTVGATVLLRIDDLDAARVRPEFVEHIFESLEALEIQIDEGPSGPEALKQTWSQVHRQEFYAQMLDRYKELPEVYACTCSRKTLAEQGCLCQKEISHSNENPALRLSLKEHRAKAWPFIFKEEKAVTSLVALAGESIAIQKKDGQAAYQITSIADDLHFKVSHIIRGADLMPSSAIQEYLLVLSHETSPFSYWHHPLCLDVNGEKLSKSTGAHPARKWQDMGLQPKDLFQEALRLAFGNGHYRIKDKESFLDLFSETFKKQTAPLGGAVL
jgi:glutamyl/glutaminyl-tRNA synthetase